MFWQLADNDSAFLLGLSPTKWKTAKSEKTLPPVHAVAERVSHLLWIARLSTEMYTLDKDLALAWMRREIFAKPFFGKTPLAFMLGGNALTDTSSIERTRKYLDECFVRWRAFRDNKNILTHLDDEARAKDLTLDHLAHIMLRIHGDWRLTNTQLQELIGIDLHEVRSTKKGSCIPNKTAILRMQLVVAIDISAWNQLHDKEKVVGWLRSNNSHPLFGGNPPLNLMCSGKPSVLRVVYSYLRNTSR